MTQKAIGPTFAAELGPTLLLVVAWTPDGTLMFAPNATAAQISAVQAIYAAHDPTKQDPMALLGQKIAAGCPIVSALKPALNATYAIDERMQQRVQAIVTGINAGKGFPHGNATYSWPVLAGGTNGMVTFTAPADFINLAAALEAYVSDLVLAEAALATGNAATWPATPVTIP